MGASQQVSEQSPSQLGLPGANTASRATDTSSSIDKNIKADTGSEAGPSTAAAHAPANSNYQTSDVR